MEGRFVVQRSDRKLSVMAPVHSQEHSIKFLKVDSGSKPLRSSRREGGHRTIKSYALLMNLKLLSFNLVSGWKNSTP